MFLNVITSNWKFPEIRNNLSHNYHDSPQLHCFLKISHSHDFQKQVDRPFLVFLLFQNILYSSMLSVSLLHFPKISHKIPAGKNDTWCSWKRSIQFNIKSICFPFSIPDVLNYNVMCIFPTHTNFKNNFTYLSWCAYSSQKTCFAAKIHCFIWLSFEVRP